jgi:hypothetical protein
MRPHAACIRTHLGHIDAAAACGRTPHAAPHAACRIANLGSQAPRMSDAYSLDTAVALDAKQACSKSKLSTQPHLLINNIIIAKSRRQIET